MIIKHGRHICLGNSRGAQRYVGFFFLSIVLFGCWLAGRQPLITWHLLLQVVFHLTLPLIGTSFFVSPAPTVIYAGASACASTTYGCCPDGKTPAAGPRQLGCPGMARKLERKAWGRGGTEFQLRHRKFRSWKRGTVEGRKMPNNWSISFIESISFLVELASAVWMVVPLSWFFYWTVQVWF